MVSYNRKTAPRVANGRVLRKNNHETSKPFDLPLVTRQRPGRGFRHVLTQRDVYTFLSIVPNWTELSRGLSAIVLAEGDPEVDGRLYRGAIELCAWEVELTRVSTEAHYLEHRETLERLGVPCEPAEAGWVTCHFDAETARGFQLLHVFLHELGHHHDDMTTRTRRGSRGEAYAETFARDHEELVWDRFARVMG